MTNTADELIYLALGGAGEIGMNAYLYGHGSGAGRRWILVDLGIGFGDMETAPGVELVLPDLGFALERAEAIEGLFLTHAHEDHVGAIPHIWAQLQVPIYARAFTAEVVRRKLSEHDMDMEAVRQVSLGARTPAGPFEVEFLPVTHSVPEASCLVIRTPAGNVLHTGDFKLDPDPQMGPAIDMAQFEAVGRECSVDGGGIARVDHESPRVAGLVAEPEVVVVEGGYDVDLQHGDSLGQFAGDRQSNDSARPRRMISHRAASSRASLFDDGTGGEI